jgi:hypothetical protein
VWNECEVEGRRILGDWRREEKGRGRSEMGDGSYMGKSKGVEGQGINKKKIKVKNKRKKREEINSK